MFKHFIISLVAVVAFAIFEYAHNKATYSLKSAWVKYVAALILGTFGFSYLTKWGLFQDIEQAGFVVAFLFFFWVIVNKLKIKGIPGQTAKVIPFVLLMAAFTSCSPDYHNTIDGKPFANQQVRQGLLDPATVDSVSHGWVDTTFLHVEYAAGDTIGTRTYAMATVMVTVKKTTYQDWKDFWATWYRPIFWFFGAILVLGGLYKYITVTSASKGPGASNSTSPMGWLIPVAIGAVLIATTTYPWSNEVDVPKAVYDTNQAQYGDQHTLDWSALKSH